MTERQQERASWIGVNAYGVFVGCLVTLLGLRHFFNWDGDILHHSGYIAYFLSGLGLLHSYWKTRVDIEVYASILLVAGNIAILVSRSLIEGWDAWNLVLSIVLLTTVSARVAALLHGGVFILPAWRK